MALKKTVPQVNNIITKSLEASFIEWLNENSLLSATQYGNAIKNLNENNANSNGYDVLIKGDGEFKPVIAEIKSNVPVQNDKYGSKQLDNIKNDISSLLDETKFKKESDKAKEYLKFMVLLEITDNTENGVNTEEAIIKLLTNNDKEKITFEDAKSFPKDTNGLKPNHVYVIQLPLLEIKEAGQLSQK